MFYMGLERDHKDIFLDVACFWKGEEKDEEIRALECCQLHAKAGLSVLERKSLITVSEDGSLEMHDSIQEMGWDIVRRDHRDEPERCSRLWDDEEIENILANDLGSEATRGIKLWSSELHPSIIMKGLKNMKKLRFLHVYDDSDFCMDYNDGSNGDGTNDEVSQYFPNALQYLNWHRYPFSSLPITFQASNLVGLSMYKSNLVQLWEGGERKVFPKLRFLELSYSRLKTLDLGLTPDLDTLRITYCNSFKELRMSAKCLKLKSLDISDSKLTTLDLEGTPNLETLRLTNCFDLVELQNLATCLKLKSIDMEDMTKLTTLNLEGTPNLETLRLDLCSHLVEVQMPAKCRNLKFLHINSSKLRTLDLEGALNLETLRLNGCFCLVEVQMPAKCRNLKFLHINRSGLTTTLDLEGALNLETLTLDCLLPLPAEVKMPVKCRNLKFLYIHGSKLTTLDPEGALNVETLYLRGCSDLVKLDAPIGCLKKITRLCLSGCSRFENFCFSKESSLSSPKLKLIVKSIDICPLHPDDSNLPKFRFECYYDEGGPSLIGNLEKLISVGLCACTKLEGFYESICDLRYLRRLTLIGNIPEVPKDLGRLGSLEELLLCSTEIKHLPDSICMLQCLKFLTLESCHLLEKLPEDLDRLECLEKLILWDCESLKDIPDNICKMKRLGYLSLHRCIAVEKLPDEVGSLEYLDIEDTRISHLPQSIVLLKHLRIIGSELLLQSCSFTSQIYETFYYRGTHSRSLLYRGYPKQEWS